MVSQTTAGDWATRRPVAYRGSAQLWLFADRFSRERTEDVAQLLATKFTPWSRNIGTTLCFCPLLLTSGGWLPTAAGI